MSDKDEKQTPSVKDSSEDDGGMKKMNVTVRTASFEPKQSGTNVDGLSPQKVTVRSWNEKYYAKIFKYSLSRRDGKMDKVSLSLYCIRGPIPSFSAVSFDSSPSFRLPQSGFRKSMGLLGIGKRNEDLVDLLFRAIAPPGEEIITKAEYIQALRTLIAGSPEDKIRFGFTLLDSTASNKVTSSDIQKVLDILYKSYNSLLGYSNEQGRRHVNMADVDEVVKKFDADHNGDIQISEWIYGIQRHQDVFSHLAHIVDPEKALKKWNDCDALVKKIQRQLGKTEVSSVSYKNSREKASTLFRETMKRRSRDVKKKDEENVTSSSTSSTAPAVPTPPTTKPPAPKMKPPTLPPGMVKARTKSMEIERAKTSACSQDVFKSLKLLRTALDEMRADMDYLQPVSVLPQTMTERRREMSLRRAVANAAANAARRKASKGVITKKDTEGDVHEEVYPYDEHDEEELDGEASGSSKREDEDDEKGGWRQETPQALSTIGDRRSLLSERIASSARGVVVTFGHEYWNTTLSIMQGIHLAAVRATGEGNRPLSNHDFHVRDKYVLRPDSIDPDFKPTRRGANPIIKFYDFAPRAFHVLRTAWNISPQDYITSCGPGKILSSLIVGSLTAISRMRSEGKSGDFFYTTGDSRYMMKTIAKAEYQTFRNMIPEYVQHMTVNNLDASPPTPGLNSLICKFCGLHKMKLDVNGSMEKIYFVVMLNCNPPEDVVSIHRRLDLKGSYAGRTAVKKQKLAALKQLPLNESYDTILKDNDFDNLIHSIGNIRIGDSRRLLLTNTMRADVKFLQRHEIMDYSLIVSCHFKVSRYTDLSRRPTTDFNNPKWQLREAFQAPVSLKRVDIENGGYKPYLANIEVQEDILTQAGGLEAHSSYVDLSAPSQKSEERVRTSGYLQKRNDKFSMLQGRWSERYFELHNMFLYYWKDLKSRRKDKSKWTAAWNLLRVDTVVLDEDECTLTLNFDDIKKDAGCDVTSKVLKCKDVWVLKEWMNAINERLHYFRSGELEASFVRSQIKEKSPSSKTELDATTQLHDDHNLWGITSSDDSAVFYIGIVDCFTTFDTTRGISYFFEGSNKSNVPPDMYARRFFNVNKSRFV